MTLSADELSAIGARHHLCEHERPDPDFPGFDICDGCGDDWPCDTEKMRAALVAAEARERENAALYHGAAHHLAPFGRCDDPVCAAHREAGR